MSLDRSRCPALGWVSTAWSMASSWAPLLHLGIQVPGLIRFGFRWIPAIDLYHPGMVKLLRLVGPRVLTMFFLQVFFIYRDHLASHLEVGAVTALNYGWFFMQVP
jgi:putative peptidoglycan lipid II flippase